MLRHFTIFESANDVVVVSVEINMWACSNISDNGSNITEQQTIAKGTKPYVEPIQETFIDCYHIIVTNSHMGKCIHFIDLSVDIKREW